MLAIRMQRTGRKGHTQFRVVVQDSRFSPSSGRVVAYLGSYNPHSKSVTIDKDKIATYLSNGAQPSERVARLLKSEGVSLPGWVNETQTKSRTIRNRDKLRRNRPAEPKAEAPAPQEPDTAPEEPAQTPEPDAPAAEPEVVTDPESADEAVVEVPDTAEPTTADPEPKS